jgi:ubiquinone biosynthesis protein UbiJ
MEHVRHDETIRAVMDKHPPYAAIEEVARLELRLRDLERRLARLERAERIAVDAVEIGGR